MVQRKLKLNMGITPSLTESMKLCRQLLTLLKEKDLKAGMIHGANPLIFYTLIFFLDFCILFTQISPFSINSSFSFLIILSDFDFS